MDHKSLQGSADPGVIGWKIGCSGVPLSTWFFVVWVGFEIWALALGPYLVLPGEWALIPR